MPEADRFLAAPCGLYCGICGERVTAGTCHGCGCACGDCGGGAHAAHCDIARCARDRGLDSCAACAEMPCTRLIQFAYDPVWHTHLPVIANLQRQRRLGPEAWLAEQDAYWQDPRRRARWLALYADCSVRHRAERESSRPNPPARPPDDA